MTLWPNTDDDRAEVAEARRRKRREWLERQGREDGTVWGPEVSEDDPYGHEDKDYDDLD